MQSDFNKKQEMLKCHGIEDADIAALTTENRIQRVVSQCKKNHNGTITDKKELDELVNKFTDKTDILQKKLHAALNLEIRYRKFTMTKVKANCQLLAQKNLSVEQKVKNLQLLLDSQALGLRALATMEDLEDVIQRIGPTNENEMNITQSTKITKLFRLKVMLISPRALLLKLVSL